MELGLKEVVSGNTSKTMGCYVGNCFIIFVSTCIDLICVFAYMTYMHVEIHLHMRVYVYIHGDV